MASSIDEITVEREEDGQVVVKQLEKHVLTRGSWATILYLCQEIDPKTREFKAPHARIIRYRKLKGEYKPQSKFKFSSAKQALEVCSVLQSWFEGKPSEESEGAETDE